jgi:hypothetical protein
VENGELHGPGRLPGWMRPKNGEQAKILIPRAKKSITNSVVLRLSAADVLAATDAWADRNFHAQPHQNSRDSTLDRVQNTVSILSVAACNTQKTTAGMPCSGTQAAGFLQPETPKLSKSEHRRWRPVGYAPGSCLSHCHLRRRRSRRIGYGSPRRYGASTPD